jgi:hypothetical protein
VKRLLASELRRQIERLFDRMESTDDKPELRELRRATERWFQNNQRRETFLNLIDRSEEYKDGFPYRMGRKPVTLNVDVRTSRVFRRLYIKELSDDFSERLQEYHEIVTTLAALVPAGSEDRVKYQTLKTLAEMFGRDVE